MSNRFFILFIVILIAGCAWSKPVPEKHVLYEPPDTNVKIECEPCPNTMAFYIVTLPDGRRIITRVPEGFFDDPKNFKTLKQYEEFMRQMRMKAGGV